MAGPRYPRSTDRRPPVFRPCRRQDAAQKGVACIANACTVTAYTVVDYTGTAYAVVAYTVTAYTVLAYTVMAFLRQDPAQRGSPHHYYRQPTPLLHELKEEWPRTWACMCTRARKRLG